jgi:hypothetical protein
MRPQITTSLTMPPRTTIAGAPGTTPTTIFLRAGSVDGCNTYGQHCNHIAIFASAPTDPNYNVDGWPVLTWVNNGKVLSARCSATGVVTYNWAVSQNDPGPDPYQSNLYYKVLLPGSTSKWGYIADTYFVRDKTGFGLPRC